MLEENKQAPMKGSTSTRKEKRRHKDTVRSSEGRDNNRLINGGHSDTHVYVSTRTLIGSLGQREGSLRNRLLQTF